MEVRLLLQQAGEQCGNAQWYARQVGARDGEVVGPGHMQNSKGSTQAVFLFSCAAVYSSLPLWFLGTAESIVVDWCRSYAVHLVSYRLGLSCGKNVNAAGQDLAKT